MGELNIESITNEALKKMAEKADAKTNGEEKSGNGKIDSVFEESVLRHHVRKGLESGEIKYTDLSDDLMESIGLELTKKQKNERKAQIKKDAQALVEKYLNDEKEVQSSMKDVKAEAEKKLKADGLWNEYTAKALYPSFNLGRFITGKKSDTKIYAQSVMKRNRFNTRVEKEKQATKDDIVNGYTYFDNVTHKEIKVKGIGERRFQELLDAGMIVENEKTDANAPTTYNAEKMFNDVRRKTGSDYNLDTHTDNGLNEQEHLRAYEGLSKKKDARVVARHTGATASNPFSWGKFLEHVTLGAVAGGAGAGVHEAARRGTIDASTNLKVNNTVNLDCGSKELAEQIVKESGGKATLVGGSTISIATSVIVNIPRIYALLKNIPNAIGTGTLVGAGIGAIAGLVNSHKNELSEFAYEIDCAALETYKDFEKYVNRTVAKQDIKERVLKEALLIVDADGKIDKKDRELLCGEINKVIKDSRGISSPWNRAEVITADIDDKKPEKTEEIKVTKETKDGSDNCEDKYEDGKVEITPTKPFNVEYGHKWDNIVKAKYPCLVEKYGLKKANLMLRKELCKDENGVLDEAKLQKIRAGWMPKHLELPAEIDGCPYEDNEVKKVFGQQLTGGKKAYKGTIGNLGTGRNRTTDATYTTECYPAIVGHGKDKESAKADYKQQLKDKGILK